jgi:uncharacterized protein (TIGR02145 family)
MQEPEVIKTKLKNIGDELQAIDQRDGKEYWITKLADGNIWMTQNLDLELDADRIYTPADTNVTADWQPIRSTTEFTSTYVSGWLDSDHTPYSASPGDVYYYTSGTTADDSLYTSLVACQAEHPDCSTHNHVGNYYNWNAAVASNNTTSMYTPHSNAPGSLCPAGWRLPKIPGSGVTSTGSEFGSMLVAEDIITSPLIANYTTYGFNNIRISPLWLTRSGFISSTSSLAYNGSYGRFWSSTVYGKDGKKSYFLNFGSDYINPGTGVKRGLGHSVRCLMK